jgi:Putative zinc ribbon domain
METKGKCQSCGMPLKADPKGGGTNADGTSSPEYCSYCYVNGSFVNPDMTVEQMKTLVVKHGPAGLWRTR